MKRCLTEESSFKRTELSKMVRHSFAKLERSTFVLVALLALVGFACSDANALGGGMAKVVAPVAVLPAELHRENASKVADQSLSPFQLTDTVTTGPSAGVSGLQQSQQTIATLSETVGSLSQQLSRKDQRIEVLEKQIDELERNIGDDAPSEPLAVVSIQPFSSSEVDNLPINDHAVKQAVPLWQWTLLCFFALSSLVYLMRVRLYNLGQSLNVFGSKDQAEFDRIATQSAIDDTIAGIFEQGKAEHEVLGDASCRYSAEDSSYKAHDSLDFEANDTFGSNAAIEDIEDLSFEQRFEQLLAEKDFAFARELLDFTRYNEINDERYHYERLRLLEKMQDEDGFYAYYYGIESKIPTFPENLQTQISRLVVMLAHR